MPQRAATLQRYAEALFASSDSAGAALRAEIDLLLETSLSFFFFKQKTAYEIVSGDWSSDVCSSDLGAVRRLSPLAQTRRYGGGDDPFARDRNFIRSRSIESTEWSG